MSGYYPHATGVQGYTNPRTATGDRATWSQHFKNGGYYTARVSKIFHMGVPGGIEEGSHGADDELSWTERFNSQGPEWKAAGVGETLEQNLDGKKPVMGGNTFVVVAAEGDDNVHSDGKTAAKAAQLITAYQHESFFLAVGFVRPHVPFVRGDRLEPDSGPLRTPSNKCWPSAAFQLKTRVQHNVPRRSAVVNHDGGASWNNIANPNTKLKRSTSPECISAKFASKSRFLHIRLTVSIYPVRQLVPLNT